MTPNVKPEEAEALRTQQNFEPNSGERAASPKKKKLAKKKKPTDDDASSRKEDKK